jgi:phage protein D
MAGSSAASIVPAKVSILVNGIKLSKAGYKDLIAVTVEEDLDAPGMFTLKFNSWNPENQMLTWVDDPTFGIGTKITVQMGYGDGLKPLIVGEITALEPEFSEQGATVVVRGHDIRHRLLRGHKTRAFLNTTDSDIAASIIKTEAKLKLEATKSQIELPYVFQNNQTDLEFLQERGKLMGYEIGVQDTTVLFRPRQVSGPAVVTLDLKKHNNLLEFSPRLSIMGQVAEIQVRGWDVKTKETLIGTAKVADIKKVGNRGKKTGPGTATQAFGRALTPLVNQPVVSQAQADTIALSQLQEMALDYITGEGICKGEPRLRAGTVVEIGDVGIKFSGLYYVTATTHRFQDRDYQTEFSVRRNAHEEGS